MTNKQRLLKQTVKELKEKVPFKDWNYSQHENTSAFDYTPSLIYVEISRTATPSGSMKYEMHLNDIQEDETQTYKGTSVKNLYEHLDSVRLRILAEQPKTEERTPEESLLEKLSKELKL